MKLRDRPFSLCLLAVVCLSGPALRAQQETTSSIIGVVESGPGGALEGARIVVLHEPTGGVSETRANARGLYAVSGLAVGGPYSVEVGAPGFETRRQDGLVLGLGESRTLNVVLVPQEGGALRLEKLKVVADRVRLEPGPRTALSREAIESQPTIDGSINELAALDPRVVYVDPERGELTAAGQNSRYNSLSVDGVKINDMYGVEATGLPSQGNPLAMETIEAVSVETSPYDVYRGGFVGASVNAVTKSGTNQFRGSLYYTYRNEKWRAKHPLTGERDPFSDTTFGATFGGPVVPGKLFFFLGYEHSERIEPAPAAGFTPTESALNAILSAAAGHGYNPGALTCPGQQNKKDDKYLAKLDWRINDRHRASLRYSKTVGNRPVFANYSSSGRVSLSGHWYDNEQDLSAWSAQLFSRWTPSLQSEIKLAMHHYESARFPRSRFPQVRIAGVDGADGDEGSVYLGTEYSSQVNALTVDNRQAGVSFTWLGGRHRIVFGAELDGGDFENNFLQNAYGSYSFASIAAFAAGTPSSYTCQYALPGRSPEVAWGYTIGSVFAQDTWMPLPRLTLMAGVRLDYPFTGDTPFRNTLVEQEFGRRNDRTIDGAYTVAPRASFILDLCEAARTRLRGGAGVFQGRSPGVWLSNTYLNDGNKLATTTYVNGFSPDPDNQPGGGVTTRRQRIDLLDDRFHLPTAARASITLDQPLPWQDFQLTLEWLQTWTIEGLGYKNINLRRTGTGPDGRPMYGDRSRTGAAVSGSQYISNSFTDVYLLTNTNKGGARQTTVSLSRPLKKHWGASLSYAHTNADEVSPVTSSVAATNYSTRAGLDPNDDRVGTANYEIRHRVLANITLRFAAIQRFDTKVTLHYEGRSGRPYSWVFGTDANGDSADYDNDLFYVPTGPDDPKVRFAVASQKDAFFAWLGRNPRVKRFAGMIAPRNSERSPFVHRFDLKFTQAVPLGGRVRGEVFLDIYNLANLLNDEWGRVYAAGFPYGLAVANANYDPAANQYIYRFTGAKTETLQPGLSRWQLQGGLRVRF